MLDELDALGPSVRLLFRSGVLFADPFAFPASIVLAYGKQAPGDSPPASLGFDENHPRFLRFLPSNRVLRIVAIPVDTIDAVVLHAHNVIPDLFDGTAEAVWGSAGVRATMDCLHRDMRWTPERGRRASRGQRGGRGRPPAAPVGADRRAIFPGRCPSACGCRSNRRRCPSACCSRSARRRCSTAHAADRAECARCIPAAVGRRRSHEGELTTNASAFSSLTRVI